MKVNKNSYIPPSQNNTPYYSPEIKKNINYFTHISKMSQESEFQHSRRPKFQEAKPTAKQRLCRHRCDADGFKVRDVGAAENRFLTHFRYNSIHEGKPSKSTSCWLIRLFTSLWNYLFCTKTASASSSDSTYYEPINYPVARIQGGSNNCFINSIAQGLATIPSWRKAVEHIPACQSFLEAYDIANAENKTLPKKHCTNIRNYVAQSDTYYRWKSGVQEDASETLLKLFNDSPHRPTFILQGTHKYYNNEPLRVQNESILHFHRGIPRKERFFDLFCNAFQEPTYSNKFAEPPQEFIIHNSIFVPGDDGKVKKNTCPMTGEIMNISLPTGLVVSEEKAHYTCDYFLIHSGTVSSGHYTSARKIEGQWHLMNDSHVSSLSEERAEQLLRTSTLMHYVRTS